jgi:hypothetical protein
MTPATTRTTTKPITTRRVARPHQALSECGKANPGMAYDLELFRREIWPRLATVPLKEIAEAAGCSKASASDIRRGKWTTRFDLGCARRADRNDAAGTVRSMTERSPMAEYPRVGVVPTSPHRRLAEALAPAEKA